MRVGTADLKSSVVGPMANEPTQSVSAGAPDFETGGHFAAVGK